MRDTYKTPTANKLFEYLRGISRCAMEECPISYHEIRTPFCFVCGDCLDRSVKNNREGDGPYRDGEFEEIADKVVQWN